MEGLRANIIIRSGMRTNLRPELRPDLRPDMRPELRLKWSDFRLEWAVMTPREI